ncbi:porin Gram-negative type [Ferrimonas balearica DSM 9799]|uniref:Porin Gram-negative type n=2 Tax=Ferrimonas balearica TaxID=44012 RepID=E1SSU6_FERBD|nr:porin Gram-negative type [Ferrimonas balearica DSM 9799]MBY5980203.1 porin [Ferrimonas balearica]MBY6106987.1 porin [Ferrimonas balearica]MBY6224456.1 porin [Ferrimonas balearica]
MNTMTRSTLAAACTTALFLSANAQADMPTFYGTLDYSITHSSSGVGTQQTGQDGWLLENNFTRLGLRGTHAISESTELFYRAEVGLNADDNGDTFSSRPTYIGLKHDVAGAISAGRIDPVLKMIKGGADIFGLTTMTMDRVFAGNKRHGDSLEYRSAKWNNIHLGASVILKDDANSPYDDNYQLALTYGDKQFSQSNFYLAAAYGNGIEGIEAIRAVAQYKINNLKLGVIVQSTQALEGFNKDTTHYESRDGFGYIINAQYQYNAWKLKAQFGQDDSGTGRVANEVYKAGAYRGDETPTVTQMALGAEYKMARQVTMHTELGHYNVDGYSDFDDSIASIGLKYQF